MLKDESIEKDLKIILLFVFYSSDREKLEAWKDGLETSGLFT